MMTDITAQMPGTILEILVKVGEDVLEGQDLIILESMKMENPITAPHKSRVSDIKILVGAAVVKGDLLMVLE